MRRGAVCTGGEVGTETDRAFIPLGGMGIRIGKRQGGLFEGGAAAQHFALLSNIWHWRAGRLSVPAGGNTSRRTAMLAWS